ncbi:MAG: hypothetical protein H7144_06615 [Burkholderiales bacterium]|nr:hypothetical protein [Phycisphaerae bacterium]
MTLTINVLSHTWRLRPRMPGSTGNLSSRFQRDAEPKQARFVTFALLPQGGSNRIRFLLLY